MKKTNKLNRKIESEKWYSLTEIVRGAYIPWCKSIKTIGNIVRQDKIGRNILKTVMSGSGKQARYRIQGKNLTEFIKGIEQGRYQLS